jgi:hypothetical protein
MLHSAEEFARLRASGDLNEQRRAGSEDAPLAVWLDVMEKFPELREWVAHNKTVPHEVLEILANDASASVRAVVASKRKLRPELQVILANDHDPSVRHMLAWNAKCVHSVLQSLANDSEPFVREAAAKRLSESAVMLNIASSPDAPMRAG